MAMLLVERGANVNAKTTDGHSALMLASAKGLTEVAKMLVERGAMMNDLQFVAYLRTVGATGR